MILGLRAERGFRTDRLIVAARAVNSDTALRRIRNLNVSFRHGYFRGVVYMRLCR